MNHGLGTALVTGASAGIGAVYADRLARRGHDLVLVARDVTKLNDLAALLPGEFGRRIEVLRADLADADDIRSVETRLQADDITMLVNNAGIAVAGPTVEMDPDRLEVMIQLNVVAATRLARAVAPGMVHGGRAISSTSPRWSHFGGTSPRSVSAMARARPTSSPSAKGSITELS